MWSQDVKTQHVSSLLQPTWCIIADLKGSKCTVVDYRFYS